MIYEHINKAETLFTKVTTLNKHDYTTWNRLGVLYANKKEYSKAIEMYMKAVVRAGALNVMFASDPYST